MRRIFLKLLEVAVFGGVVDGTAGSEGWRDRLSVHEARLTKNASRKVVV